MKPHYRETQRNLGVEHYYPNREMQNEFYVHARAVGKRWLAILISKMHTRKEYMSKNTSRGPDLNIETCVKNSGGNRYTLVLQAAERAREIAKANLASDTEKGNCGAAVSALLEIQSNRAK